MSDNRYVLFLRTTTYATGGMLGALILSSAMPPLMTTATDRAVLNAPVITLTAPIDGTVVEVTAGDGEDLSAGALVATIGNQRIEQATLTQLKMRLADIADRRDHAARWAETLEAEVAGLEERIARKAEEEARLLAAELREGAARLKASEARVELAMVEMRRQRQLTDRNVVSASRLEEAISRLDAARGERAAEEAALVVRRLVLKAVEGGIFVGDKLSHLAALENELRERTLELAEARRTLATASQQHRELARLAAEEEARIAARASSPVKTPFDTRLVTTFVTRDQDVRAGETLAHAVDCGKRRVVAIFSQRHGDKLHPGRMVKVRGEGWRGAVPGHVERVLPHTTEMVDRLYAVPFPPIERRELYVIVALDREPDRDEGRSCAVGEWVTVELGTGLIPTTVASVRDFIRMADEVVLETAASAAVPPPASAQDR